MSKILSLFFILFGLILTAGFTLHSGLKTNFFDSPVPELISFSYKFNFGITFLFTLTIIVLHRKFQDLLGFFFLAGSAIKLAVFVFLIRSKGFEIDKSMFLDFFIPYLICLFLEVYFVAKLLGKIKDSDNQKDI